MNVKDSIQACYCNQKNLYFNVSICRSRLESYKRLVSVSGGERLGLELLRLVPIPEGTIGTFVPGSELA